MEFSKGRDAQLSVWKFLGVTVVTMLWGHCWHWWASRTVKSLSLNPPLPADQSACRALLGAERRAWLLLLCLFLWREHYFCLLRLLARQTHFGVDPRGVGALLIIRGETRETPTGRDRGGSKQNESYPNHQLYFPYTTRKVL